MTSRISTPDRFPVSHMAAGSGPVVQRQFVIGNEDLIGAITDKLGGNIPPGTTMKAEYDTDKTTGAILATIENTADQHKFPMFTFWRTFTVEVPGEGTFQFRKQIFTNLPVPSAGGVEKFQKSLELAAMASSVYSKICCDAILVKGGGKSKKGLDNDKIDLLQKKTFVEFGLKLSDMNDKKTSDLRTLDAKVGTGTVTFDLKKVKPGKTTSFFTRHQKFVVENPPLSYVRDKVKFLSKLFDSPVELTNQYMDGGASDEAIKFKDAHAKRTKFPVVGEVNRSAVSTAREFCEGGNNPTVREAYANYGADLKRAIAEIQSQRDYLSHDKPSLGWRIETLHILKKGWHVEWLKLGKQQKILEERLHKMQNDWPGLFEDINTEATSQVNASHPKAAEFKQEAKNLKIPRAQQAAYVAAKVDIELAESGLKDLQEKLNTQNKQLQSIKNELNNVPADPLKTNLEQHQNALNQLIQAEMLKIEELTLIKEAAQLESEAAKIVQNAAAKKMLDDSKVKREEALAKDANEFLKIAKKSFKESEELVIATRAKIADDAAKAAADARKAQAEVYLNSREAQDLAPSEREAYVNKKLEIDDQIKLIQAKQKEIQPLREKLQQELAAVQAVIEDPRTPDELHEVLKAEKEAIEALIANTNISIRVEDLNLAAKQLELQIIVAKGSDPEFKHSGKVSKNIEDEMKGHAANAKAQTDNAAALTKELKTDELTKKAQTAKENTAKAREQLKEAIDKAETSWTEKINQLPESDENKFYKNILESFKKNRKSMNVNLDRIRDARKEIAKLEEKQLRADPASPLHKQYEEAINAQKMEVQTRENASKIFKELDDLAKYEFFKWGKNDFKVEKDVQENFKKTWDVVAIKLNEELVKIAPLKEARKAAMDKIKEPAAQPAPNPSAQPPPKRVQVQNHPLNSDDEDSEEDKSWEE